MKHILMSIKPQYCEKIISGEKTIEIRKTAPKEVPFKVYMYCTSGTYEDRYLCGKVVGEFICNQIETIPVDSKAFATILKAACITMDQLIDYCSGKDIYGLHISNLKIYDKPKELSEFYKCDGFIDCITCKKYKDSKNGSLCQRTLTRPPQSWCYVENGEIARR